MLTHILAFYIRIKASKVKLEEGRKEEKNRRGKNTLEKAKSIIVNVKNKLKKYELFLRSLSVNVYILGVYQKTLKERRRKKKTEKKRSLHL